MNKLLPLAFVLASALTARSAPPAALCSFEGPDFAGGAKDIIGTSFDGEKVNTVYAQPTGAHSRMQVKFSVAALPGEKLFVHLKARDDDAPKPCAISIKLNETALLEGADPFPSGKFTVRKIELPPGMLKTGQNTLVIACTEKEGSAGQPPWFQVASCVIAPASYVLAPDLHKNFRVSLPAERREFPEPLPAGKPPGFKFRGTKGWAWTPEQYLQEIPWLAKFKMNFLMNCYLSMFDIENQPSWSNGNANRWWEDLPESKKKAYEKVVRSCQEHGVQFCFGMNPNLVSKRFISADSPESIDQLYKHYAWMQSLGVKWFNISLDDITQGINASSHAQVVNTIFKRLREKDPGAQMIFCPTYYWGDGTGKDQQPYLETLARELHPDVYVFWTGDAVVGTISRKGAETFRRISGHKVFLWDNYPVNDDRPTMHLGPVIDRDPDLCEVVDGYMGNPHCKQSEINRIPLATCADYAYNPAAYDPARSIGQAILQVGETPGQRVVLRDLVEAYPGMLIWSPPARGTGFNAVQEQFALISGLPHSRQASLAWIEHLQDLHERFAREFPNSFKPARETLKRDIDQIKTKFNQKYN